MSDPTVTVPPVLVPPPDRPSLTRSLPPAEFARWYWSTSELQVFARLLGVRTGGGRQALTARISAALSGAPLDDVVPAGRSTAQLVGGLTGATVIPAGQRCSQLLRAWFTERVGPGFRFDVSMRAFFAATSGSASLDDALRHWYDTRRGGGGGIGQQFEDNRFTRAHRAQHPDADRAALLAAWSTYRNTPLDARGRVQRHRSPPGEATCGVHRPRPLACVQGSGRGGAVLQQVLSAVFVLAALAVALPDAGPQALLAVGALAVLAAVLHTTVRIAPHTVSTRSPQAIARDERGRGSFRRQSHPRTPGRPLPRAPQAA